MDSLVVLYEKIEKITNPSCISGKDECSVFSGKKYKCCSNEYCNKAKQFAKDGYGIELEPTGNKDVMFMGDNGCIVAPHLRPICTVHVCSITWAAKSMVSGDEVTREYFSLREKIFEAERVAGHKIYY